MKPIKERRVMIRKDHSNLSIVKQSKLLQIHRSGLYYKPKGESALNLELMRLMDDHFIITRLLLKNNLKRYLKKLFRSIIRSDLK